MGNLADIDRIEELLRGVIPDLLLQLGWREASKVMRRLPSIRHDLQRLARMTHVLDQMQSKVEKTQERVKSFEVRVDFDENLRSQFTLYLRELDAFAGVLVETKHLIEDYLAQKSLAAVNNN